MELHGYSREWSPASAAWLRPAGQSTAGWAAGPGVSIRVLCYIRRQRPSGSAGPTELDQVHIATRGPPWLTDTHSGKSSASEPSAVRRPAQNTVTQLPVVRRSTHAWVRAQVTGAGGTRLPRCDGTTSSDPALGAGLGAGRSSARRRRE
jgi:hypothetical protein